jgi:hypothetical protein
MDMTIHFGRGFETGDGLYGGRRGLFNKLLKKKYEPILVRLKIKGNGEIVSKYEITVLMALIINWSIPQWAWGK